MSNTQHAPDHWPANKDEWPKIVVSAEDFEALQKALDNPPEPTHTLRELFNRIPIWEQEGC